jgi:hypothetical protein
LILKNHDADDFAADTACCICDKAIFGRIGYAKFVWNGEVYCRAAAGAFSRDSSVGELRNESLSLRQSGTAQKVFGKRAFFESEWAVLYKGCGWFLTDDASPDFTNATSLSQSDLPELTFYISERHTYRH